MALMTDEEWTNCWEGYKRSAWRMETQPTYTMPAEQRTVRMFLAGEPRPEWHNAQWHKKIRGWAAVGKSISRVRFVRRPLTDYQRYQLAWGIPSNGAAGEDVRILDRTDQDFGLPEQDFWIFDDSIVVELNFNPDGTFIDHVLVDDPDMDMYRTLQATAITHSVPFREWDPASG